MIQKRAGSCPQKNKVGLSISNKNCLFGCEKRYRMSEETLIHFCSPTLAGIKTGNLFSSRFESRESMMKEIRRFNEILAPKGILILPLLFDENTGRGLIYLYRPTRLAKDLEQKDAADILKGAGYTKGSPEQMIEELKSRIHGKKQFPHEIGLFLSYPPEDVRGFMEHHASGCKCVGTWKVYGDEKSAKKTFEKYSKCQTIYQKCWQSGMNFSKLAVAAK